MMRYISLLLFIGLAWGQPITIAVFDLENNGLQDSEVRILTDRLQSELVKVGDYTVVERKKIEKIFEEQKFQMSGCVEECLIEIGMLLGAKQIVIGSVGRFGSTFTISARLVNATSGEMIRSSDFDTDGNISDLLKTGMQIIAMELSRQKPNKTRLIPFEFSTTQVYETPPDAAILPGPIKQTAKIKPTTPNKPLLLIAKYKEKEKKRLKNNGWYFTLFKFYLKYPPISYEDGAGGYDYFHIRYKNFQFKMNSEFHQGMSTELSQHTSFSSDAYGFGLFKRLKFKTGRGFISAYSAINLWYFMGNDLLFYDVPLVNSVDHRTRVPSFAEINWQIETLKTYFIGLQFQMGARYYIVSETNYYQNIFLKEMDNLFIRFAWKISFGHNY